MKITGYLYALVVSLLLTIYVSNFYNVTNTFLQGITLTLLYIFTVHFAQGDTCLIYGIMDSKLIKMLTFQDTCDGGNCTINNNSKSNNKSDIKSDNKSDNIINQFVIDEDNQIVSSESLNSKVHANTLYEENELNENRLYPLSENNKYYSYINQFYPMLNKNQINQQDCTNDMSCFIPEDHLNMHPVKQSLKEVLPIPNIGPQILTTMNRLNPHLNVNQKYPVPVEANHSYDTTDISNFYTDMQTKNNECQKCIPNNVVSTVENKKLKETFGLFETYNMENHIEPLYINSPPNSKNMCHHCVTGGCQGDLCSIDPNKKFVRNDPLGM